MEIRAAVPEDALAACEVMRRSISELCEADHRNDPVILGRWLANKAPETVASPGFAKLATRSWSPSRATPFWQWDA
jgi:hypothetical protein